MPPAIKIPLPPADGSAGPPEEYWNAYFRAHNPGSPAIADLIQRLHAQKKFEHAIAALEAALLHDQMQPWMYDVLALTMQLAGRPKADIERALMSRLDFMATDVPNTLFSAAYLTRFGAKEQALRLYRQAADLEPTRPEAYVLGLRLAREMRDYPAIQWGATGILQTAWTKDHEKLHREAEDAALDAERALAAAGKTAQAEALRAAMAQARIRDLFVRVQWTGDGDLDLSVEEPLGTITSCQDPQSRGGGVHMHDGYGPEPRNCYEEYICPFGVPGVYVVRVRRIDGTIVGKRAQLTVVRNQGAPNESTQSFVLKLDGDRAALRINVPDGRRRELVPQRTATDATPGLLERLVAVLSGRRPSRRIAWRALPAGLAPGVAVRQSAIIRAGGAAGVLAPPSGIATGLVAPGVGAAGTAGSSFVTQAAAFGGTGLAVGLEPVITVINEGVTMNVAAVVSSDLRFVRLAVTPSFITLSDVFTFTFLSAR